MPSDLSSKRGAAFCPGLLQVSVGLKWGAEGRSGVISAVCLSLTWQFSGSVRAEGTAEEPICCCSEDKHSPHKVHARHPNPMGKLRESLEERAGRPNRGVIPA